MYATAYRTKRGFWSVGFLADVTQAGVRVADPVLGYANVRHEDTMGVVHSETGYVLPDVHPVLISDIVSLHLAPQARLARAANQADVVELRPRRGGAAFPSGYPAAWQVIQRFRKAVDWRFVALSAIFARTTIQRPIDEAERLYLQFGPTFRDAILRGKPPTEAQMLRMRGIKGTRAERRAPGLDDVATYAAIFEWAPWCADFMRQQETYSREVRDGIALSYLPRGLGIAKLSFTMMLSGRDAACLDTRMLQWAFDGDKKKIETWNSAAGSRSGKKSSRGFTASSVQTYRSTEDLLAWTPYFDPDWPQPYAKAQWMLWETIGRTAGTATHGALWEVLGPVIEEAGREVAAE